MKERRKSLEKIRNQDRTAIAESYTVTAIHNAETRISGQVHDNRKHNTAIAKTFGDQYGDRRSPFQVAIGKIESRVFIIVNDDQHL